MKWFYFNSLASAAASTAEKNGKIINLQVVATIQDTNQSTIKLNVLKIRQTVQGAVPTNGRTDGRTDRRTAVVLNKNFTLNSYCIESGTYYASC